MAYIDNIAFVKACCHHSWQIRLAPQQLSHLPGCPRMGAMASRRDIEARAFTGKDLLLATIVGYEVSPRLGKRGLNPVSPVLRLAQRRGLWSQCGCRGLLKAFRARHGPDSGRIRDGVHPGLRAHVRPVRVLRQAHAARVRVPLGQPPGLRQLHCIKTIFDRAYGGFLSTFSHGSEPARSEEVARDLRTMWQADQH
ncbi:hypothetical protein JB92DRAFT_347834 [Gautieria morchelliformis]|nr:hypothetical protein JB92DRAFT_347834 [Gautieria morchelliformis]